MRPRDPMWSSVRIDHGEPRERNPVAHMRTRLSSISRPASPVTSSSGSRISVVLTSKDPIAVSPAARRRRIALHCLVMCTAALSSPPLHHESAVAYFLLAMSLWLTNSFFDSFHCPPILLSRSEGGQTQLTAAENHCVLADKVASCFRVQTAVATKRRYRDTRTPQYPTPYPAVGLFQRSRLRSRSGSFPYRSPGCRVEGRKCSRTHRQTEDLRR